MTVADVTSFFATGEFKTLSEVTLFVILSRQVNGICHRLTRIEKYLDRGFSLWQDEHGPE
jgi:hypothetical protein